MTALPPGWIENIAPSGHPYYYHSATNESTYTRPKLGWPQKQKEKAQRKTAIPGTEWIRIVTTEGKVFYRHNIDKKSVWTVPAEIQEVVAEMEEAEKAGGIRSSEAEEIARVKAEVSGSMKRKAHVEDTPSVPKKPRIDAQSGSSDDEDSDEEEWQQKASEQLAKETIIEKARQEEEQRQADQLAAEELKAKERAKLHIPEHVNLSSEEAKALFKTLLREKDVNPLYPWDKSLPLFVSDPRYVLLPSVNSRRDAFDEYCRERIREQKQNTLHQSTEMDPKADYDALLEEQVKSTRMSWTEFRRSWKKDRRFYSFGRDDRERERRFKEFIRQLGEKKRAAARKAEADFFLLLKQKGDVHPHSAWKDVKRKLYGDPRYDAVGSSSLREELFNTFKKSEEDESTELATDNQPSKKPNDDNIEDDLALSKTERKERAVKDREDKVRADRNRIQTSIEKSKHGMDLEEGSQLFRGLLVDAVREPQATWESVQPELKTDPRFHNTPLPLNQQLHLFHSHISHLRGKYYDQLFELFKSHSPNLDTPFKSLAVEELLDSPTVMKLGLNTTSLGHQFEKWQLERRLKAKTAFDEMLNENSFIEFWGRLGKIGGEGINGGVKSDEIDDADDESAGKVDMKELAKQVNVQEIIRVISNDKRYFVFDHVPEQREQWIRDYLANLSAPKLSVHLPP